MSKPSNFDSEKVCLQISHPVCSHPLLDLFLTPSKGLFKETFSGCKIKVNLLGITANFVFSLLASAVFTLSVTLALNASQTSKLHLFPQPPLLEHQTFSIHVFIPLVSFKPCSQTAIKTACLFTNFGIVLLLKITVGFSLLPSPTQVNMTVTRFLLFPIVRILLAFSPVL